MAGSYELFLFQLCLSSLIEPSHQGLLPSSKQLGRVGKQYINQKHISPLKTSDKLAQADNYENSLVRKSLKSLLENVASYEKPLTLHTQIMLPDFDENGMIILNQPKSDGINGLINKIIGYKMAEKSNGYLRNNPQAIFDVAEIEKIKQIAGSLERDERPQSNEGGAQINKANVVFEFTDLVA